MANAVYPKFKAALINGGGASINLLTGAVRLALVDTGAYTYAVGHQYLSDIPGGAVIATSGALASKSVGDDGSFKSGNGRFDAVFGPSVEALVGYLDTGSPATSPLIWFQDTGVTGLPVTPAGASYNVVPDSAGWFIL